MKSASEFKAIKCSGYANINSIVEIRDRLHSSETLFGDVNASLMVLGQDGAPYNKFKCLIEQEGEGGFRHGPDVKTNQNLIYCLSEFLGRNETQQNVFTPNKCGVFYANAIWLLKLTEGMSGALPNRKEVMRACVPVFEATVDGLKKLSCIITLGRVPYEFMGMIVPTLNRDWRQALTQSPQRIRLCGREILVGACLHPSPLSGGKNLPELKKRMSSIIQYGLR